MLFLCIVLSIILLLPLLSSSIEKQLELFLFFCGLIAVIGTNQFSLSLLQQAVRSPLAITGAVFIASLLFFYFEHTIQNITLKCYHYFPKRLFLAMIPFVLGFLSSIITAIIASLLVVKMTSILPLSRPNQIRFVILNCFAIGIGAVLTPIGEPLSTIVTNQLQVSPTFLFHLLSPTILPMLFIFSVITFCLVSPTKSTGVEEAFSTHESIYSIIGRTGKIYLFVFALTLLGVSFQPFVFEYVLPLDLTTIYWINMLSAVLDNATLAAAEISPLLADETVQTMLISLLISGGMLIPGNIPNIIAAKQLSITSLEWAKFGVPLGLILMVAYYFFALYFQIY